MQIFTYVPGYIHFNTHIPSPAPGKSTMPIHPVLTGHALIIVSWAFCKELLFRVIMCMCAQLPSPKFRKAGEASAWEECPSGLPAARCPADPDVSDRAQPQPKPHQLQESSNCKGLRCLWGLSPKEESLKSPCSGWGKHSGHDWGPVAAGGTPGGRHNGFWLPSNSLEEKVTC